VVEPCLVDIRERVETLGAGVAGQEDEAVANRDQQVGGFHFAALDLLQPVVAGHAEQHVEVPEVLGAVE
jgi:hypothetical protein